MKKKSLFVTAKIVLSASLVLGIGNSPMKVYAESSIKSFSDTDTHWAKSTIQWAVERNIVKGYDDFTFKPDQQVSEAEFLTMLIRTYNSEIQSSTDGNWADNYYNLAKEKNYSLNGYSEVKKRDDPITRLQVAELIVATQGKYYEGDHAITYLYANKLASGSDPNKLTIAGFNGSDTLTRAEAVQFIKNLFDNGEGGLLARPETYSNISVLPDIPHGDDPTTTPPWTPDLGYLPPAGWTPPHIVSTSTDDFKKDQEILEEELGFTDGYAFNIYGKNGNVIGERVYVGSHPKYYVNISFTAWYGLKTGADIDNKIPYIARELFKFYLPNKGDALLSIIQDGVDGKNIDKYYKPFTLDGREVLIVNGEGSFAVQIGYRDSM